MGLLQQTKNFIKENKICFGLFLIATLFFILQHYFDLAWDFASYVLNAKYLFWGGSYFEVYRAPLISLILGPLLVFGKFAEYLFILLISGLFFYSVINLSDALYLRYFHKYRVKKEFLRILFVFFCLNPFVLIHGLLTGTELLGISFFILFLVSFIKGKISGHWLALAVLSRYNFLIFLPFLFFNKDWKKILKNIGLFIAFLFPWLLFNFLKYGNWFTSILDSYHLNVLSRESLTEAFQLSQLLPVFNWFIIFFVLGMAVVIWKIFKKYPLKSFKYEILFLVIGLLFFYDFYTTPYKIIRYTFNLFLPIAFFCVLGIAFFSNKIKKRENLEKIKNILMITLILGFTISLIFLVNIGKNNYYSHDIYLNAQNDLKDLGLENCTVLSPHWAPLNYYNENSVLLASEMEEAISERNVIVIFKGMSTKDDTFDHDDLENYPIILEKGNYYIFGKENLSQKNCNAWEGYDSPMVRNSCDVVSEKFKGSFLEETATKTCNLINFS
ncbi:MAG: hypothetical protein ACOC1P_04525 [Minisyncoccales bacterium]